MSTIRRLSRDQWTAIAEGCWALAPKDLCWKTLSGASATMIVLQSDERCWLIDAGRCNTLELFQPLLQPRITDILITHAHPDHVEAVQDYPASTCWISRANPVAWQQAHYMLSHWQRYCHICHPSSHLSRALLSEHLSKLKPMEESCETCWQGHVIYQLLQLSQQLYPRMSQPQQHMNYLEELPLQEFSIHSVVWNGWDFGELKVIPTRGHSPDHVVAWWQPADLWIVGDELTAVPVWTDSDHLKTIQFQHKLMQSLSTSSLLVGGHQPACFYGRETISSLTRRMITLSERITDVIQQSDDVDSAYERLLQQAWFQPLLKAQFPYTVFFAKQFIANWMLTPAPIAPATPAAHQPLLA